MFFVIGSLALRGQKSKKSRFLTFKWKTYLPQNRIISLVPSLVKTQRQKYIQIQKCGFGRGVDCGYNALHNLHESWTLNLNRMMSGSQANMCLADMDREQQQGSIGTRWIGLSCKSKNKNLSNCIASTSGKSKRPLWSKPYATAVSWCIAMGWNVT